MSATNVCGWAKTVLVTDRGGVSTGVTTAILAHTLKLARGPRIRFRGDVVFEQRVRRHISRVILPLVDGITAGLGLSTCRFEISGANIGAASQRDVGVTVSGFSADLSVFLAMLSARLQIPVGESFIATGCIASRKGDIRMVRNIPAKLDAALADPMITTFVYPSTDGDTSLGRLAPEEKDGVRSAVAKVKGDIRAWPVSDIQHLVRYAFTPEHVCYAAMRTGFFGHTGPVCITESPITQTIAFLGGDSQRQFEASVRHRLLAGDQPAARSLLVAYIQFRLGRRSYPAGFGTFLRKLVLSVPPSTRMAKLTRPLIPTQSVIALSQFAAESDYGDVRDLHRASEPPSLQSQPGMPGERNHEHQHPMQHGASTLDWLLREISEEALARRIEMPIDAARATYVMERNTVESVDEFYSSATAFYIHLLSYSGEAIAPVGVDSAGARALQLLENAYLRWGGKQAAYAEASTGIHGGLRHVFDVMTERHKQERREEHIHHILETTLDGLSRAEKRDVIAAFTERCAAVLPPSVSEAPAAKFVEHTKELVRVYVASLDRVKRELQRI